MLNLTLVPTKSSSEPTCFELAEDLEVVPLSVSIGVVVEVEDQIIFGVANFDCFFEVAIFES